MEPTPEEVVEPPKVVSFEEAFREKVYELWPKYLRHAKENNLKEGTENLVDFLVKNV